MLISFTLKNWMSFRDEVSFSMVASGERQHGERLPKLPKYRKRILPISAIYGGNASGKTNLFKALSFAKRFVVEGMPPDAIVPIRPFLLDDKSRFEPSSFCFEILAEEKIFEFSFSVHKGKVSEEKTVEIAPSGEKTLYHRVGDKSTFADSLGKDQQLEFAFRGTRDNQLFLTNSVSQKLDHFRLVYNWFRDVLELVAPDTRFGEFEQFLDERSPLHADMNQMLQRLDTGIFRMGGEMIPFESLPVPSKLKETVREHLTEGKSIRLWGEDDSNCFVVTRKGEDLVVTKLVTYHPRSDGAVVKFEIEDESDGSKRAINLLPAFLDLSDSSSISKKVYVIDEVDRSLHTLLTRGLLETYLANCSAKSRTQLLMTTHDVLLMDQDLLRRDEMWLTERSSEGASTLSSFCEFKDVRYDKDVRKSYLQGRLGGIPRILLEGAFSCPPEKRKG